MKDKLLARIAGFFIAIFAVTAAVAYATVTQFNRVQHNRDWVNARYALISAYENIIAGARAGEAATIIHALRGDTHDLTNAREAFADADEHLQIALAMNRDEPDALATLTNAGELLRRRAEFAEEVWRAASPPDALKLIATSADFGRPIDLQRAFIRLRDDQFKLLSQHERFIFRQAQTTRWLVTGSVFLSFTLLVGAIWLIRDGLAARRRAALAQAEANAQLELKVQERTSALLAANTRLTAENLERRWAILAQEHQIHYNQAIVDSVSDLVFMLTRELAVTRINPAVLHASGRSEASILSHPLANIVHATQADLDRMTQALEEGHELRGLLVAIGDHAARLALIPLRDRDKVIGGIAIVQLDRPSLTRSPFSS